MNTDDPFEPGVADILRRAHGDDGLSISPSRDLIAGAHRRYRQRRAAQWAGAATAVVALCVGVAAAAQALPHRSNHPANPVPTVGATSRPVPVVTPVPTSSGIAIGVASPTLAPPTAPVSSSAPSVSPSSQKTVNAFTSATSAAEPAPTRPTKSTKIPSMCASATPDGVVSRQPDGSLPVTPGTPAQDANDAAMGRQLCGYITQLNATVTYLHEYMTLSWECPADQFGYHETLWYGVGAQNFGIDLVVCQPQAGKSGGGSPSITMSSQAVTSVRASWPDGTNVTVMGYLTDAGGSSHPMPNPAVLRIIAEDPAFDPPFAGATPASPPASGSAPPTSGSAPASASPPSGLVASPPSSPRSPAA